MKTPGSYKCPDCAKYENAQEYNGGDFKAVHYSSKSYKLPLISL